MNEAVTKAGQTKFLPQIFSRQYLSIFVSLIVFYLAALYGLHAFMLDHFAEDFLERRWLAPDESPNKGVLSAIYVIIVAHLAAMQRPKFSDFFLIMLAVLPILPMIALYSYRGAAPDYVLMCVACYFIIWLFIRIPLPTFHTRKLRFFSEHQFTNFSVALLVLAILVSIAGGNLGQLNFDFDEVYNYRREAMATRNIIVEYVILNLVGLFIPLSLALCLKSKRHWTFVALISLTVFLYGLTSHKSYFFMPFFVISFFLILSNLKSSWYVIIGLAFVIASAAFLYGINNSLQIYPTLTIRRMFFVPAYANFLYNDFFSISPKMYWSDSRLTLGLVNNPYGVTAPRVILSYYHNNSMTFVQSGNSNTGFLGAGYAHAAFVGMIVYSVVIAGLLRVGNVLADKIGFATACAGMTHLFISTIFCSTDTISTFLSYGSLMLIVIAATLKPSEFKV